MPNYKDVWEHYEGKDIHYASMLLCSAVNPWAAFPDFADVVKMHSGSGMAEKVMQEWG